MLRVKTDILKQSASVKETLFQEKAQLEQRLSEIAQVLEDSLDHQRVDYVGQMTAVAVIDQIRALPPEERAKVFNFVREMEPASSPPVRYADEKTFSEAAAWTFHEHGDLMRKLSQ